MGDGRASPQLLAPMIPQPMQFYPISAPVLYPTGILNIPPPANNTPGAGWL